MTQSEIENKATIEERAYKAVPDMLRINENYVESFVSGYYRGATEQKQIDDDKYKRLRELAYAMYSQAQHLSTDGRGLRKAIEDFYHYINYEENN